MGGLLAGCGGSASAVITGVALPCVGLTTTAQYAKDAVEVAVKEGSRIVASQTVTGRHAYRFVVPPGRYMVYSNQFQVPLFVPAVLHSGETDHVNLVPHCK
jgi:hypothetical protein